MTVPDPSTLSQRMMTAIQANNGAAVQALVQRLPLQSVEGVWLHEAIQRRQSHIVSLLQPHYNSWAQEVAASWAYECQNDDLAEQIRREYLPSTHTHIDSQPFNPFQALCWSAGKGWTRAVEQWLNQDALTYPDRSGVCPLEAAASRGDLMLTQRLFPLFEDGDDRNLAIYGAAKNGHTSVVGWLWPRVTPTDHEAAMNAAATAGSEPMVNFLLDQSTSGTPQSDSLCYALCETIKKSFSSACVQRLATFTNLNAKRAEPLRTAVAENQADLIAWLVPQTDVELARKYWTAQQPAQWDMVQRVFPYLASATQEAWIKIYKNRPAILATWRDLQAQAVTPEPEQRRRRLRT